MPIEVTAIDHIVLCVWDVRATLAFYTRVLGMEAREERPGKWSLHFRDHKISVQDAVASPSIARTTPPGSGNFCLLTALSIDDVLARLAEAGIAVVEGPAERSGATGPIVSVYFTDPDGNLVEVSSLL